MRVVGWMALGLVLLAGSASADEIYRSTDAAGRPVFSNGRGGSGDARQDVAPAAAPATEDAENFSTGASLRRQALERDLRTSERRLRDLDTQLAALARARTRNAGAARRRAACAPSPPTSAPRRSNASPPSASRWRSTSRTPAPPTRSCARRWRRGSAARRAGGSSCGSSAQQRRHQRQLVAQLAGDQEVLPDVLAAGGTEPRAELGVGEQLARPEGRPLDRVHGEAGDVVDHLRSDPAREAADDRLRL